MDSVKERMFAPLLGIPIGVALVWCFWLYSAHVPISFYERAAHPLIVYAGEEVTIRWTEVRTAECKSIIHRSLLTSDGKVILFEDMETDPKPLGRNAGSFTFTIPPLATPGPLTYRVNTEFVCNWVQALFGGPTFVLPDIQFEYRIKPAAAG